MITIIIVTYNAASTLQNCLNSIYKQQNRNLIKIIVIDGKSTDDTFAILQENNAELADWVSEKDNGIYEAMNKGIKRTITPWVYFLGADDELLPDFSKFIEKLQNQQIIYYSNVIYKDTKHSGKVSPYHQAKLGIFHQSIIYPTQVFQKYQYNTHYKIAADYALNLQLHKDPYFNFEYHDYTISKYNDSGISASEVDLAFERDKLGLIFNNFNLFTFLRYSFRQLKQYLRGEKNG